MKNFQKIFLAFSISLNIVFGFLITKPTSELKNHFAAIVEPFTVTNLSTSITNVDYVVAYKNGIYWWNIGEGSGVNLSMNIGFDEGATLRLDKSTGKIKSTTIQLLGTNGTRYSYIDLNADGIPDKKYTVGDEQIFYDGKFFPDFFTNNERFINIEGLNYPIQFNGEKWVLKK